MITFKSLKCVVYCNYIEGKWSYRYLVTLNVLIQTEIITCMLLIYSLIIFVQVQQSLFSENTNIDWSAVSSFPKQNQKLRCRR
jgi:hypothetical protein